MDVSALIHKIHIGLGLALRTCKLRFYLLKAFCRCCSFLKNSLRVVKNFATFTWKVAASFFLISSDKRPSSLRSRPTLRIFLSQFTFMLIAITTPLSSLASILDNEIFFWLYRSFSWSRRTLLIRLLLFIAALPWDQEYVLSLAHLLTCMVATGRIILRCACKKNWNHLV